MGRIAPRTTEDSLDIGLHGSCIPPRFQLSHPSRRGPDHLYGVVFGTASGLGYIVSDLIVVITTIIPV
jgi:hypothetical protein